jgi:hypothetical protein
MNGRAGSTFVIPRCAGGPHVQEGLPERQALRIKESDDLQLGCIPGALTRSLFHDMQDI